MAVTWTFYSFAGFVNVISMAGVKLHNIVGATNC